MVIGEIGHQFLSIGKRVGDSGVFRAADLGSGIGVDSSGTPIAIVVVIGIFCKNFLDFGLGLFRVTFENLPILAVGLMFGPIVGGIAGAATDIISYLLSSQVYPINPLVTLGAVSVGLVAGLVSHVIVKHPGKARVIFACAAAHIVGSMIIKPFGLFQFYGWAVLWRIPLYFVITPVEIMLLCLIRRNRTMRILLDGQGGKRHEHRTSH
jgi:ECF transporter S component (folate family)